LETALFAQLLSGPYLPFSLAIGLLFGLLALEIVALVAGGSLFAAGDAAPDFAADAAFDLPAGAEPDVAGLLAASDAADAAPPAVQADGGTAMALLGLGRVPFAIWLAALLFGFGVSGMAVQALAGAVAAVMLPGWLAALPATVAGLFTARATAGVVGGMVRQNESTATGPQFLGGLRGTVTQGTARRGSAAEVRLRDRHGNLHYQRCEPWRDGDVVAEGSEVLTLRLRQGDRWVLRILPIPA
jgi:hypothetical protein